MVVLTTPPYCDADPCTTNSYTPSDPRYETNNAFIKSYGQNHTGWFAVDAAAAEIDATLSTGFFGPANGMTAEGTHFIILGGYRVGKALASALTAGVGSLLPPPINAIIYNTDPSTLVTNGMMTGTGGTAGASSSGSIASSWTLTGAAGATCVGSKNTRADGLGAIQTVVLSGGTASSHCDLSQTITGWTANVDTLQAQAEIMSGSTVAAMMPITLCYNASCAAGQFSGLWEDNLAEILTETSPTFIEVTPLRIVPVSATSATVVISIYGAGTVNIGRVEVHKR
jgi:hypothetical protein